MHRALSLLVAIILTVVLVAPATAAGTVVKRRINTSNWAIPSPDPTGLAFLPSGRLLVVDSEVEETPHNEGKNVWRISTTGQVLKTFSTKSFTTEPTDVAVDPAGIWYFSDDGDHNNVRGRVFVRNTGPDGRYGTSDDKRRSFATGPIGAPDLEALAFGANSLWLGTGSGRSIVRIRPGADGRIDGGGDDVITSWSVAPFGIVDVEGVTIGPKGHVFVIGNQPNANILEFTKSGSLIRSIDLSTVPLIAPSDIAWGPASANPSKKNFYISDRGVDNNANPNENDGRIFEVRVTNKDVSLIANGSFGKDKNGDTHPDRWSENVNFTKNTHTFDTPGASGRHFSRSDATYSVRQVLSHIRAGETYHFSGRVNIPNTSDDFRFRLRILWFGPNGGKLSTSVIHVFDDDTGGAWHAVENNVTAPTGAVTGKIVMSVNSLNGRIFVDTFSLTGT
jgi:hypothetical protein